MSYFEIVKTLKFSQVKQLIIWFFKHPFFLYSAIYGTAKTLKISQREFPNIHGKNNKANAFRHALWNILIAKKSLSFTKDINKVILWTKTFTDWREDLFVNKELARLMDLHNNSVGRDFFFLIKDKEVSQIVHELKVELTKAKLITTVDDLKRVNNSLVFLE